MPATGHEEASSLPVSRVDGWPVPGHFSILPSAPDGKRERATIVMNDRREVSGEAIRLDCPAAMLQFRPDGAKTSQLIAFASFKSVCLARPVELGRLSLAIAPERVEAHPSQARLSFTIRFKDGTEWSSPIVGIVARGFGLFPFLADDSGRVFRWFMPAEATAGCRIGDPLGKILVECGVVTPEVVEAGLEKQRRQRTTKLGEYLCQTGVVTRKQVEACVEEQRGQRHLRLGDVLVARGLITSQQRDHAVAQQAAERGMPLGEILVLMGAVTEKVVRQALVDQLGIPWVSLRGFPFEQDAIDAIPVEMARRRLLMPLYRSGTRIAIALGNPVVWDAVEEIEAVSKLTVDAVFASTEELADAVRRHYGPG